MQALFKPSSLQDQGCFLARDWEIPCRGFDRKYFQFCRPYGRLCGSYLAPIITNEHTADVAVSQYNITCANSLLLACNCPAGQAGKPSSFRDLPVSASCPTVTEVIGYVTLHTALYVASGDPSSGPQAFRASEAVSPILQADSDTPPLWQEF